MMVFNNETNNTKVAAERPFNLNLRVIRPPLIVPSANPNTPNDAEY